MTTNTKESRSSNSMENLQELIDTGHTSDASLEQYFTPPELAAELTAKLPVKSPATIFDPQCGSGSLLKVPGFTSRFGIELDETKVLPGVNQIHANCMKVFEAVDELMPELRFVVANANPPFGRKWRTANGDTIDSTLATWRFVTRHAKCGYFIANPNTIEKFDLHHGGGTPKVHVTFYERRDANLYWKGLRDGFQIGLIVWQRDDFDTATFTPPGVLSSFWNKLKGMLDEEKLLRPKFNIYLSHEGFLKTYLSQRHTFKKKLTPVQIARLSRINDAHPLALTTEKETRVLMRELIDCGLYNIEPVALEAIEKALAEVSATACPIMPVSDFETVAYTEEEEALVCHRSIDGPVTDGVNPIKLTAGKSYKLDTGSYQFSQEFVRDKVHFDEERKKTYTKKHQCVLSGTDRYITLKDDWGREFKWMDRPRKDQKNELAEQTLWDYFTKPKVNTVAETCKDAVATNQAVLNACEMMAGYKYYAGQLGYLSRVAVKDSALIAGDVGTGKTLLAISMLAMKSPQRALIIAPQGTMRASKIDDEDDDDDDNSEASMSAAQWLKEITKFAPYLQVFEIFSYEDYAQLLALNNGQLPYGVYVTYFEAFFLNKGRERSPDTWDDKKLNEWAQLNGFATLEPHIDHLGAKDTRYHCDGIGREDNGIRCIMQPCLSTMIGHLFDCVIVDEAHRCKGMSSLVTQMLIRLQPKHRYCFTATPVANVVTDLFPLMGWIAVPEWHKGDRRNAAWPYAREDYGRFNSTFLTQERDMTEEDDRRAKDKKWRGKCVKDSPIISSPARLLKLIKPNLAFISKEECRADYIKPKVTDVRVPMGREQAILYGHFTNRANIHAKHPLVRARKQSAYLRNICADPAGFHHGGPKVSSNMNPKVIAILELVGDILARGEQVVIINSRVGLTETLVTKLTEAGVAIARIDSTHSAEQHAYQANLFKLKKAQVMAMGIKCAAAYSFDDCQNLIIGSLEYSWGTFAQACGRIDRVTNAMVKNIYCILHENSIEEVQFETVGLKGDAANLCLRGRRIPRDFKPVDGSEILAKALERFDLSGSTPESQCESNWPKLRQSIASALATKSNG